MSSRFIHVVVGVRVSFLLLPKDSVVFFGFFLFFLASHPPHMEVPKLEVESELQQSTYTTAHGNTGSQAH